MSAFFLLPKDYRDLCDHFSKRMGKFVGGRPQKISPQNARVRFAADAHLASLRTFPNVETRQQRRVRTKPWKKRQRAAAS